MPDIKKFSKYITRIDLNINFKALLKIFFSFFFKKNYKIKFQKELSKYIGSKNIFLTGSGRAALFLILNQISKKTKKKTNSRYPIYINRGNKCYKICWI
jgi:hypothetical protein